MQINREWERTVASNWSGFIGALSVSKSISFGHLLWLRFSHSPPLPSLLSHRSQSTYRSLSFPLYVPARLASSFLQLLPNLRSVFLLTIRPIRSSVKYTTYTHSFAALRLQSACIRRGGGRVVINQELVPSGHFIRVVEMRTNEEYYTATVMRQSFRFNFVYALAVLFPQKKRTNRSVQDVRIRTKFLSSPSPPPFLFLPAR